MTPEELAMIDQAARVIETCPEQFASTFYETLFEIAPTTRAMFPDDLTDQRGKLVDELAFLIGAARDLDTFVERAHDLGRRHAAYGVHHEHYEPVGAALTAALRDCLAVDWDAGHDAAWTKLYRLIADVMQEGANSALVAEA